ncbi:MAG TPA: DinB family protein [Candidatus Methylomirabilis sp.]|nr:DinB family protein [Candidatus Methylomirabilis sp.]
MGCAEAARLVVPLAAPRYTEGRLAASGAIPDSDSKETAMALPPPVDALWNELESIRADLLEEIGGLSQVQADWRPGERDWSIGEIVHHLVMAEVATGKLTSKLLKEAGTSAPPFPAGLSRFPPLPPWPPGPAEAPPAVRPEEGHKIEELVGSLAAARERSRQSVERLATVDPRSLKWPHPRFGEYDLAQWWLLQARHDADHLQQLRAVKASPGFPRH